jgi:hypothetical protein
MLKLLAFHFHFSYEYNCIPSKDFVSIGAYLTRDLYSTSLISADTFIVYELQIYLAYLSVLVNSFL